jgi:alkylation response protein AidB-like acyl-CoA dehydrogenase
MAPQPVPPDDALVPSIREFAEVHRLAARVRELDRQPEFPREEFRAMGAARLLGLRTPTSLGGRGLPLPRVGVALFHLARASGTLFAKLSLQPEFSSVLASHGSADLVDTWFRPMVRGNRLVGNHLTEPDAGSDVSAISMRAERKGDRYVLTGTKSEAAFAADADAAIVYARIAGSEPGRGITAFLVPQDLPGVSRSVGEKDLGEHWQRRGTVAYDAVEVPAANRIGEEGAGFRYVRAELTQERALLAAIYLGVGWASWEETVRYVGTRQAFGHPLSTQEAVGFPLVEDAASLEAAWLYVERTLLHLEQGLVADGEAAMSKWMATETALRAIDHAIQFHGGRGYSGALPHEQRWRDVRSGRIAHGPAEIMHVVAARSLWAPEPRRPDGAR